MIANTEINYFSIYMPFAKYLSNLFLGQESAMMSDFIYVAVSSPIFFKIVLLPFVNK